MTVQPPPPPKAKDAGLPDRSEVIYSCLFCLSRIVLLAFLCLERMLEDWGRAEATCTGFAFWEIFLGPSESNFSFIVVDVAPGSTFIM